MNTSLPEMQLGFPVVHHPLLDDAEAHAQEWVAMWKLVDQPSKIDFSGRMGSVMAAYGYPRASREVLYLATDFMTWLYAMDDGHVDRGTPDPVTLLHPVADVLRVLEGQPGDSSLSCALADLLSRYAEHGSHAQLARFREHIRGYVFGCLAETVCRARGAPSS